MSGPDLDDFDDDLDDGACWRCGGEGIIVDCQDEIGCVDPEWGCDLCTRSCPECRARQRPAPPPGEPAP